MRCLIVLLLAFLVILPSSVFSQGANVIYAVGEGSTILKLEYGTWVPVDLSAITGCGTLLDIWGSSEDDIYVTGCYSGLLHYDGVGWEKIEIEDATPSTGDLLRTVGGTGPDNIFVAGVESSPDVDGIVYHFDGIGWSHIESPYGTGFNSKLWADHNGGFYALAYYYSYGGLGCCNYDVVMKYNYEGVWETLFDIDSQEFYVDFNNIDGFGWSSPVVVGDWDNPAAAIGGLILMESTGSWSTITQSQDVGCGMYFEYCPVWPVDWFGVCRVARYEFWASGENGRVLHYTIDGYTEYDTGVTGILYAIWKSPLGYIYAAGDNGKIVYFDGGTWTEMSSGTTASLRDLWGLPELPVATLLQSSSVDVDLSGITIGWTLSEIDDGVGFRVLRRVNGFGVFFVNGDGSNIERNGLSFKYVDPDVQPGTDYEYIVEYSSEEGWKSLFETDRVTVPKALFGLITNFPNPFNPSTKITYSIPDPGHVSLKIYDVSGRLVRTILDEVQGPGEHFVPWNGVNDQGKNVVSGTYFCRLISGKQAVTRKMLLMR